MPGRRSKSTIFAIVLIIAFAFGLIKLFLLRFEAGDIYPTYSSLRSDPLGTQVLFESLVTVTGDRSQRNFRPLDKINFDPDKTVLMCALTQSLGCQLCTRRWEKLMTALSENGGRLVLAFEATSQRAKPDPDDDDNEEHDEDNEPSPEEVTGPQEEGNTSDADIDAFEKWRGLDALGLAIERATGKGKEDIAVRVSAQAPDGIPDTIPWRGALYFDIKDDTWQTRYTAQGQPVIMERPWGRGTIVMMADSYLLSNEAMRRDRLPALLAYLFAPGHEVLFDEFHLGLARQPGIVGLAIKYRLHGIIGVILLITMLIIWQQTVIFVPAPRAGRHEDPMQATVGHDTAEGLIHLMRQHIPPAQLLKVCYHSWQTSAAANTVAEERITKIKEMVSQFSQSPRSQNPVEVYRHICQLLKQGKIL